MRVFQKKTLFSSTTKKLIGRTRHASALRLVWKNQKGILISTKFTGSTSHFRVYHFYIGDVHSVLTSQVSVRILDHLSDPFKPGMTKFSIVEETRFCAFMFLLQFSCLMWRGFYHGTRWLHTLNSFLLAGSAWRAPSTSFQWGKEVFVWFHATIKICQICEEGMEKYISLAPWHIIITGLLNEVVLGRNQKNPETGNTRPVWLVSNGVHHKHNEKHWQATTSTEKW